MFAYSSLVVGFSGANNYIEPPVNASFEEFEKWFNNHYEEYKERSDSYRSKHEKADVVIEDARLEYLTSLGYDLTASSTELPVVLRGDILITDQSKSYLVRHGHAALVQDEGHVIEIFGSGHFLEADLDINTYWYSDRIKNNLAILYPDDWSPLEATKARDWEYERAINEDIPYELNNKIYDTTSTYCSKSCWQAWYYGADRTIADPIAGWVLPKMLYDSKELYRLYDSGLW